MDELIVPHSEPSIVQASAMGRNANGIVEGEGKP